MRLTQSALFALFFLLFQSCGSQITEPEEEEEQSTTPVEAVVSYFVGNSNIDTSPVGGICLMGGRSEDDQAMRCPNRRR